MQEDEGGEDGDDDDEEEVLHDRLGDRELAAARARLVLLVLAVAIFVLVVVVAVLVLLTAFVALLVSVVLVPAEEQPRVTDSQFAPIVLPASVYQPNRQWNSSKMLYKIS